MRVSFGERFSQALNQMENISSTFRKWWNEPDAKGGPSRKEQFKLLLQGDSETVAKLKTSLERYLAKPLLSRNVRDPRPSPSSEEPTQAMSAVVKELDSVLKEYATKPLPKPPSKPLPKIPFKEFTPPSSPPPPPPKGFPEPPDKPVPPIPLDADPAARNTNPFEMEPPKTPPPSPPIFPKTQASKEGVKSRISMGAQRMIKPTRPLPPLPKERPLAPSTTPSSKPSSLIPPKRRSAPQRPNRGNNASAAAEASSSAAPKFEGSSSINPFAPVVKPPAGPSVSDFQDIKGMVNGKVEVDIEKNLLRDLILGENKADTANQDSRKLRGEAVLKKYKVLKDNQSYSPSRDKNSVGELIQMLEQKGRELQKNIDRWYANNGGNIQF